MKTALITDSRPWLPWLATGLATGLATLLLACGPATRDQGDLPDALPDTCVPSSLTESCSNQVDDDCDTFVDCDDTDCSGVGSCPVVTDLCQVAVDTGALPLPDGDCQDPGNPTLETCQSEETSFNLTGFPAGETLTDTGALLGICLTMEHSYMRDIQIEALCPDGNKVALMIFAGLGSGGEVFMGQPNDSDSATSPQPGVGAEYCWRTDATNPDMLQFANASQPPDTFQTFHMPAGNYQPEEAFSGFQGCTLNGAWKIRVTDQWSIDNGFIFGGKMLFRGGDSCPVIE